MTEEYCGFVCADYVEKAWEIKRAMDEFAIHNPEEAREVWAKIYEVLGVV